MTTTPDSIAPAYVQLAIEEAAPQMLIAERKASIHQDIALAMLLWTTEGRIVDARGTEGAEDDLVWEGREAVLDRYILAVFPSPPPPFEQDAQALGEMLSIQAEGTLIDGSIAVVENGHDRWRFIYQDARWWLAELVYSLP